MRDEARLEILSQPLFTRAGRMLLGLFWDEGQERYEAFWAGADSPQRSRGEIFLLGWMQGEEPLARLALWKPALEGQCLFFLYARHEGLSPESVSLFLERAKAFGREHGMKNWVGPMAFSTWHPYRFIRRKGSADYFPGEDKMPEEYPRDFEAAGFLPLAKYHSDWVEDLGASTRKVLDMGIDLGLPELRLEVYGRERMPEILPDLYRLSCEIFSRNFAYSEIGFPDFLALSSGGKGRESALIMASVSGKPAGFIFSYSIGAFKVSPERPPRETAVVKTLGVLREFRKLRLGYGLTYLAHNHWLERGCSSVIHAYMKTDNHSQAMSARFGVPMREYVLLQGEI